ncbi:hypothetical protein Hanom_Chr10g00943341 [Helianthus anomalus]
MDLVTEFRLRWWRRTQSYMSRWLASTAMTVKRGREYGVCSS